MAESWLKIGQFIISTFGLPGALLCGIILALLWMYKNEREDHKATRAKVDEVNEKRIEAMANILKALGDYKISLDAVIAMGKQDEAMEHLNRK